MNNGRANERRYISVSDAARILGISRTTAYKLCNEFLERGVGLPCIRLGKLIRVPLDALDKLIEQCGRSAAFPSPSPAPGRLKAVSASRDTARSPALPVGAAAHADDLAALRP